MTGFGRGQVVGEREILVEIKSVNHRYFEFSARVPRLYGFLEARLKSLVQAGAARGKVEASVQILQTAQAEVQLNQPLLAGYAAALRQAGQALSLPDDLTLSSVLRLPELFTVSRPVEDEEAAWQAVRPAAEQALAAFCSAREQEGRRLRTDLLQKLEQLQQMVQQVEARMPGIVQGYYDRLYAKLTEVLAGSPVDSARVVTEAAVFADKVATDEETVRLKSHVAQFVQLLDADQPVGRKLDFLVQEINREINTIGSKANDLEVSKLVIEMKSLVEKLREQIQNIE